MRANIKSILADGFSRKAIKIGLPALVSKGTIAAWGLILIFVIRVLPSESYAAYAVARSIEMFGVLLGGDFIMQAITKFAAEGEDKREKQLSNAGVILALFLSVIVSLLLLTTAGVIDSFYNELRLANLIRIITAVIVTSVAVSYPKSLLVARHKIMEVMLCDLAIFATKAGIVSVLLLQQKLDSAIQVFQACILANIVGILIAYPFARKLINLKTGTELKRMRELLSFAWYTLGTSLTNFVYTRTDILMIGKLARPEEVAAYGSCRAITGFFANVNQAANMILLPLSSRMWVKGRKKALLKRVFTGITIVEIIILPAVFLIALAPGRILHFIYGGRYDSGRYIFLILGLLALIRPFGSLFAAMATGIGKPVFTLYSLFVSAGFNLVLNFLLIPRFGGLGAAFATVFAVIAGAGTVFWKTYNYCKTG